MRHLILIVAIWWFGSPVESAEINVNAPDSHGRIFVDIVGQIAANDDKAFEQKTAIHTRYNKVIVTLSGPGFDRDEDWRTYPYQWMGNLRSKRGGMREQLRYYLACRCATHY
jgi:hypothetical protein